MFICNRDSYLFIGDQTMLTINETLLKPISIGYVANNKLRNTIDIEVVMAETTPFVSGELVSGVTPLSIDGVNSKGEAQTFAIQTTNTIRAEWLGDSTNRITPPDVRRGEKVQIFQYSNVDKYYWQTITQPGINVRKKETIVEAISNTTDESQTKLTAENSWYKEFSTHDKRITVKTNKSDGEKWAYTMQLDVKSGNMVFADDTGMFVQVNSEDESIELGTTSGGLVKLVKKILTLDNLDEFIVNSKKGSFNIGNTEWKGTVNYSAGTYTYKGKTTFTAGVFDNNKSIGIDHQHGNVRNGDGTSGGVA